MRVLLVDPDPESRAILGRACKPGGHELSVAGGLVEAREHLDRSPIDVVAADLSTAPDRDARLSLIKDCDKQAAALVLLARDSHEVASLGAFERRVVSDFEVKPLNSNALTARLEAIRIRREARSRERALLDAMPDMMFRLKKDGTYVDYHVPRGELLYAPPEDFLGRTVLEMLPPGMAEQTMESLALALESGSYTYDYELPLEGLGVHEFEARLVRSAPDEVLAIVRDVTEQRRTVAALAESERTMRALLAAMPDTMFRATRDGVLLDYIPRLESPLKQHRDQLLGMTKKELIAAVTELPAELVERVHQKSVEALDSGEDRTVQYALNQEGRVLHHEARLVPCGRDEILGIVRDITDLKRAEEELRAAARVKQAFANRVLEGQEGERQHIARELHDVIGQRLLVHRMDAEWIAGRGDPEVAAAAEKLCSSLDETLSLIRDLAQGLRPPALDDLGIGCALETLIADIGRRSGVHCECVIDAGAAGIPMPAALTIYRIAQEAIANAVRHARCGRIALRLKQTAGAVVLEVEDDGAGIPSEMISAPTSLGLTGMRERAELLGGRVTITAADGGGTVVLAEIPQPSNAVKEAG